MDDESEDLHERPTLPAPQPVSLRFETPAEQFFTAGIDVEEDELLVWWTEQRRRAYTPWVAGVMALCVAVLVVGVIR